MPEATAPKNDFAKQPGREQPSMSYAYTHAVEEICIDRLGLTPTEIAVFMQLGEATTTPRYWDTHQPEILVEDALGYGTDGYFSAIRDGVFTTLQRRELVELVAEDSETPLGRAIPKLSEEGMVVYNQIQQMAMGFLKRTVND